jgi:DNA-binding IclR family transcriptional regulator
MKKSTYTPVQSNYKFIDILEFLCQQTGPASGTQIAHALEMAHGTVMSHLQPALDRKWVRQVGEMYEVGSRISGMYAIYLQGLKDRKASIEREITKLEV